MPPPRDNGTYGFFHLHKDVAIVEFNMLHERIAMFSYSFQYRQEADRGEERYFYDESH
jgi:hypothetical protein